MLDYTPFFFPTKLGRCFQILPKSTEVESTEQFSPQIWSSLGELCLTRAHNVGTEKFNRESGLLLACGKGRREAWPPFSQTWLFPPTPEARQIARGAL